jgi:drug/metabolite transporter (DMT)-like permease
MRNSWIVLSFVGLFSLSTMTLLITYLVRKGFSTIFVLFVIILIVGVIYGVQIATSNGFPATITLSNWLLLISAALLSALGNLAIYRATAISPNPGLVITIFGLQAGIVSIVAVWLFKDKLNPVQVLGIALGIIAIVVIGLGSRSSKNEASASAKATSTVTTKKSLDI